jgi:hypothetical protein
MAENESVIGDRWGVTDSETTRSYPCDDFVASPALQLWRGQPLRGTAGRRGTGGHLDDSA